MIHVYLNIKNNNEKGVLKYVTLTNLLSFQTRFPKVGQQTGGKWLIPGTTQRKDNQLQNKEPPCRIA